MGKFKKIFLSKKAIALELVLALILAGVLWFFINKASHDFSQDPDMGLVNGTDSTMISTPIDGTKPSDHDPKQNAYYALYALNKASSFVTHCEGETITQVTFVSVSQKIKSMRVVNNGEMYKESISHSSFKGVGVRNYINGDNYVTLNADSVTSVDDVVWNSDAKKISKDDYVALYGYTPAGISGYILTDDTILSAEYLGEENGVFSYHYELDTVKSVAKLGLEMRTMAGTASLPIFEKASITIRVDENWNIISTTTNSVYAVDMLGGVTCTEEMTEVFSNLGDGVEIPNVEFFRDYLDDEVSEVGPTELTASDYLMQGFGEYITGDKPLKVALALTSNSADLPLSLNANALINIDINDLSNISAYIDVANLTYDSFTFNDIGIAYLDGDIYLNYKDIKAKANVNDAITKIEGLLPLFDAEMPSLNLGNIDLASLLESATVSKDGTNVAVNLPLSLAGIDLNATLYFVEDDGITFTGANATVMGLEINLTPDDDIVVDTTREGYSDLLSLLDVIDSNGKIALDVAIGDINAEVVITIKPFALDVKLGDITAKLSDNVIYINYKDIKAKLDINDIEGILNTLAPILEAHGVVLPDMSGIANIDINAILTEVIDNLTTSTIEGGVKISTTVMDLPLDLVLSNANGEYTIASISTKIEDMAIVVEPTTATFDAIADVTDYCDITSLLGIIDNNAISLKVSIGEVEVLVKVDLLTLDIDVKLGDITAKLSDNVIYINYKDIKAKLAIDDIEGIIATLKPILETHGVALPDMSGIANIDINAILTEVIDNLTTSTIEGGVKISTKVMDLPLDLVLSNANGKYTIASISTKIEDTAIVVEPTTATFDAIADITDYCDITSLLGIIDNNAISLKVSIDDIEVLVKVDLLTLDIDVKLGDITAKLSDNVIYINYKDIKAKLAIDDIEGILNTLAPILEAHGIALPDMSGIANIDINAILTEVIDNLTTSTIEGGVKISTTVMDLPLDLVLSNTDSKYTIASISTTVEDMAIVVEPTTATFDAIADVTDYCDITSLLGIIDNNAISLKVTIGEVEVLVKVDLLTLDVDVKLGEITAKLSDNVIYVNYKDIKAKLDINDIEGILNTLAPILEANGIALPDMSGIANIDVNAILTEVIDNLTTSTIEGGVKISTTVMDLPLDLVLSNADGEYTIASISTTVKDMAIVVEPTTATFDAIADVTDYCDITSLLGIIDNNAISLKVSIGEVEILVKVDLLTLDIDVKLGDITAKLSDNVIYVNYKDIKAKLAIDDIEGIIATLKPILEAHGVALPDMSGLANIDINAILTEVLDNLTTSTIEGGVKISTTVMDLPLDLVLSNANGEYTIASISTTVEDMAIVVEPTTDTFDAISNEALGNYSNIATLLDMIDDNYDIHLSVLFDGADIRVTFNVIDLTLTATYDGLEVYADLNTGDVYLTYPGVRATVNINDADYILEKLEPIIAKFMDTSVIKDLDLGAVTNIDFGAILDTLTVTESEGKVVLGLDLNGVGVNVTLTTTNGMRLDSAVITMGDTDITAIVLDTPNVKPVFDFTLEYSDAKALVDEFSDILTSILYSDSLSVKVGGSIVSGNTQFTIVDSDITIANITTAPKATAYVVLEQKDLTTGTAFTHTVTLTYLDPSLVANDTVNVYFTYDNSLDNTSEKATKLEGTFKTTKAGETWDIIKEIYKLMPDIQKALDGILVPDENGYPTLPKFDFPVTELIKSISFKDGLLSGYLDTSVIIESLPELLGAEIRKVDNTLNVTIPTFTMADMSIGLGVDITVPETTTITDDKFSFDTTNASDFSSINELLLTLKNTATARSFHITGNLSAAIGSWEIASDAVSLDVKLDVTEDGLTFAKVVIDRKDTSILGIKSTWNDYGGTSTLYYDAENELIYVHVKSKTKWLSNTYSDTYYTYTVEEYTADLMPRIFELINLSSTIQDAINKEDTSSNSTTPATVENTLLGYAYDDAANKFSINLDLTALLTDIGALDLTITHTDDMKLSKLYAKVNMVNIINLTLNAELESQGVYQGVKEDLASVKSQFPTK